MITRNPIRPHVCLRCQRSLTKRFVPSKSQAAFQSTSNLNPEPPNSPEATPRFRIQRVPAIDRRRPIARKHGGPEKDTTTLHGHRGRKLQEKVEDLKTNSLGDTAKVLVLRDSKYNFYTYLNRMKDQEAEHVDIEALLAKERGLVGPNEVHQSLSGIRKGKEPQTWEELNEVVGVLSDGFTYSQLLGYLEANYARVTKQETVDNRSGKVLEPVSSRHIVNVTSWMPGVSDISDHFDEDPLRGYYMPSHTSKQKLALKILRECWEWELPEINEGIGQFEVQIGKGDLDLMSKGANSALALLHGEYLAHEDEGLEVFPSRGIIRVTTMRHKMGIVMDILARDLDSIQRETIYLGELYRNMAKGRSFMEWQERIFNDMALDELGQITNTDISRISKDTLLVSSFGEGDNSGPSRRIDTVKRLLTTVSDTADQTKYSLECNSLTDGMFIKYPHVEGLNWREKMREWVRWTAPVSKDTDIKPVIGEVVRQQDEPEDQAEVTEETQESNVSSVSTNTTSWWNDFKETSALFGSILHTSMSPGRELTKPFDSTMNVHRGFSSVVPNLSRSLQKTNFFEATDKLSPTNVPLKYITLRFLPDPFQAPWESNPVESEIDGHKVTRGVGSMVLKHLPQIEMRFSVLEDNSTRLKDVLAVLNESKSDVMLPSNGVDIRFQDRTTRRLKYAKNMETLRDFVTKSTLDLRRGKMVIPPSLRFPIDPQILTTHDRRVLNLGSTSQDIQYMFAGLDIRSTLVFNWKGWRVLYTSIEAGQSGGRRGELKLRPIHSGRVTSKQDFIKAANELAHELGDSPFNNELAFGSPVERVKQPKRLSSSAEATEKSPSSVPVWGVDSKGVKGGKWERSPALFDEKKNKTWFVNQAWYDEPWDQDEEPSIDLDEVDQQRDSGDEERGSK